MTDDELNEAVARKLGSEVIPYVTMIECAWEILNYFHEVTLGTLLIDGPCWFCEIRPQRGMAVKGTGDTVCRAIVDAFLKVDFHVESRPAHQV
jgi:hypothetical protein